MHKKEPQEPPEHTSDHVKSQNFLGACPQTPSHNPFCGAPIFVFAVGPPNPLGDPGMVAGNESRVTGKCNSKALFKIFFITCTYIPASQPLDKDPGY